MGPLPSKLSQRTKMVSRLRCSRKDQERKYQKVLKSQCNIPVPYSMEPSLIHPLVKTTSNSILDNIKLSHAGIKVLLNSQREPRPNSHAHQPWHTENRELEMSLDLMLLLTSRSKLLTSRMMLELKLDKICRKII